MNKRIIFQLPGQPVAVMVPVIPQYVAPGVLAPAQLDIQQIGQKDVPPGVPFWIVDASDVPVDRTLRNAWRLDLDRMGPPAGFGGGNDHN